MTPSLLTRTLVDTAEAILVALVAYMGGKAIMGLAGKLYEQIQ